MGGQVGKPTGGGNTELGNLGAVGSPAVVGERQLVAVSETHNPKTAWELEGE